MPLGDQAVRRPGLRAALAAVAALVLGACAVQPVDPAESCAALKAPVPARAIGLPTRGATMRHLAIDPANGDLWIAYGASPAIHPTRIARLRRARP